MRGMDSLIIGAGADSLGGVPGARVMTGYRYLVEEKLGQDVCTWVKERTDAGVSLRGAARELTKALGFPEGIRMSHTVLQNWCQQSARSRGEGPNE